MTVGKFRACSLCWPVNFAGGIGKRLLAAAGLAVVFGCTTVPTDSVMPRPGDGIREYQRHLADYRSALVDSVRAVERLAGAPEKSAASAYANAQTTAHRLELVSIRA